MDDSLATCVDDNGDGWVSSMPGGTRDVNVHQSTMENQACVGALSEETYPRKLEDLSRKQVQSQEQDKEKMVVEKAGAFSGLERDAVKTKVAISKAEHRTEKGKTDDEIESSLVRMDDLQKTEKEPEMGEGEQQMKDGAGIKVNVEKERKGKDVSMSRESDKDGQDGKERTSLLDEKKEVDVKRGGDQTKVDAEQGEKQMKVEKSLKNLEKEEECTKENKEKYEKKVNHGSGQPEGDKKREKKDKKSKTSSERIQKKLEKVNAKIGRILAKKEEYELRLKEAQDRERHGSEKAALKEREASTAVMGEPANEYNGPGLRREETVVADRFRLDHDASTKESNYKSAENGFSVTLSRTASLIEVSPAELIEEVAGQKRMVEKLGNLLVNESSVMNAPLPMDDLTMKGKGKV